jgi:hypothetical protein
MQKIDKYFLTPHLRDYEQFHIFVEKRFQNIQHILFLRNKCVEQVNHKNIHMLVVEHNYQELFDIIQSKI